MIKGRVGRVCCVASLAMLSLGCGLFGRSGAGGGTAERGTLDLTRWALTKIDVDLVNAPTTLCPGQRVQLSIVAEAKHRKRDKVRLVQTYEGNRPGLARRTKLGFDSFVLQSGQGRFDAHGWYTPSEDPFVSVHGFTLEVEHTPNPKLATTLNFKPAYDCVRQGGGSGPSGSPGRSGSAGASGDRGKYGGSSEDGGAGGAGGSGSNGGEGTAGAAGPRVSAWATVVRTPHHEHLVLLEYEGDMTGRAMFDSHTSFVLAAAGGPGGRGGAGGSGGPGGSGGGGSLGGGGGAGGPGGTGGMGGPGGAGGHIDLVIDERFPELAQVIRLDVSGGNGGSGGAVGDGGQGGSGGHSSAEDTDDGPDGSEGADGTRGSQGRDGAPGVANVRVGGVDERFSALPEGVTRL
ncbi:MAG: hypothetical protein ACRBN8_16200 [Nannocystales bacterium]